jgi:hypothetical protein
MRHGKPNGLPRTSRLSLHVVMSFHLGDCGIIMDRVSTGTKESYRGDGLCRSGSSSPQKHSLDRRP